MTTVATTHTKVNTEEAPTYDELFIDATNCGTAGDTHPKEIVVDNVHAPGVMKHIQWYNCLQVPAERE